MKTCILSANCQGEALKRLFAKHTPFTNAWEMKYYVNFHKTPIPDGEIENCDLFIYQTLGESWGDLSTKTLLGRLPQNTKSICLPNILNLHLWPTAVSAPQAYDLWLDSYVENLISKKLSFSEIVFLTMHVDFSKIIELPTLMKNSLRHEYEKEYFKRNEIFKFIEENWQRKYLFTTPNHPANELLLFTADLILKEIDIPLIKALGKIANLTCDNDFFLPVHPFFIDYYQIKHLTKDSLYPVFGNELTYKEYLMGYVDARLNNIALLRYFTDLKK